MESGHASGAGSLDESPPIPFPRCAPPRAPAPAPTPPPSSARVPGPISSPRILQRQALRSLHHLTALVSVAGPLWPLGSTRGAGRGRTSVARVRRRHAGVAQASAGKSVPRLGPDAWGRSALGLGPPRWPGTSGEGAQGAGAALALCGRWLTRSAAVAGTRAQPAAHGGGAQPPRGPASVLGTPSLLSHREPLICSHVNFQKRRGSPRCPGRFPTHGTHRLWGRVSESVGVLRNILFGKK